MKISHELKPGLWARLDETGVIWELRQIIHAGPGNYAEDDPFSDKFAGYYVVGRATTKKQCAEIIKREIIKHAKLLLES